MAPDDMGHFRKVFPILPATRDRRTLYRSRHSSLSNRQPQSGTNLVRLSAHCGYTFANRNRRLIQEGAARSTNHRLAL